MLCFITSELLWKCWGIVIAAAHSLHAHRQICSTKCAELVTYKNLARLLQRLYIYQVIYFMASLCESKKFTKILHAREECDLQELSKTRASNSSCLAEHFDVLNICGYHYCQYYFCLLLLYFLNSFLFFVFYSRILFSSFTQLGEILRRLVFRLSRVCFLQVMEK